MYFLIHTSYHARPFLTTVAFIARDFRTWGCRVDCHASDSPYIAEIKLREKQARNSTWRAELMELWAREVISRKRSASSQEQDYQVAYDEHLPAEERRFAKVSNVVQDFIHRVAAFDQPSSGHTIFPTSPRPLPASPYNLVSKYLRLLHAVRYTSQATLSDWFSPSMLIADQVVFEFRFHAVLKMEHLVQAMTAAMGKDLGRTGRVTRDLETGNVKVLMLIEVGDCVMLDLGGSGEGDEEGRDPVPKYERVEGPPAYVKC